MTSPWSDLDRPPLSQAALRAAITGGRDGQDGTNAQDGSWRRLDVVEETGSTNADLTRLAIGGEPAGLVLVAEHQSAGRGRLTRAWTAPPRSSVIVSVLLRPAVPAHRYGWLSLLAGLAVVEAVRRQCGIQAVLKWPNDVLLPVPGRDHPVKAGGVLAEVVHTGTGPAVVVGIGLNVSQAEHELPVPQACSLRLAGAATLDRDTLLRAYLRGLAVRYRHWTAAQGDPRDSGVGPAYREACSTLGTAVEVHLPSGEVVRGQAQEVDDDGRLVVLAGDTPRALAAGDVVHVRPPKA